MPILELAIFGLSALVSLASVWFICRRTCSSLYAGGLPSDDTEECLDVEMSRGTLRLQVSTAFSGAHDGEFDDCLMTLQPDLRTVGDVVRALAATLPSSDPRQMLVHCLDEDR